MVSSFFHFRGRGAGHSIERLGFVFFSSSQDFRFTRNSQLYAIADGQRIALGGPASNETDVQGSSARERLVFSVAYKIMVTIANAKHVEMRLGSSAEFELNDLHLSDLKALLAKIQAVKK